MKIYTYVVVIRMIMMLSCPYFIFIDTSILNMWTYFLISASAWGLSLGELIRPFCIMILYQYLLHYGLLLHIISQYLCLFSLILQGLYEEGECRQLEFWAGKGANIRDLFYTTPKVLKLHESQFWNILKILGEESTWGGHPPATRVEGAPYPLGAPLPRGPPGRSPMSIFCYMVSFSLEKNQREAFRMKRRCLKAEPGGVKTGRSQVGGPELCV